MALGHTLLHELDHHLLRLLCEGDALGLGDSHLVHVLDEVVSVLRRVDVDLYDSAPSVS